MRGTTNFNLSVSLLLLMVLWGFAPHDVADISEQRDISMLGSSLKLRTVFHDIEIESVFGLVDKR